MSKKDLYNKFENFADELEKQLDLLGLVKENHKPLEISYAYDNHSLPLITIDYCYRHISSPFLDNVDYYRSGIESDFYDDISHANTIMYYVRKYIKERKQEAIKQKLKEIENDFEPSRWSKFVNCVHKLLRNLWSLLNKQDTWYLIALFPLFGALIYTGYYIFNMCFAFFSSL
jgi:hypothetical protein